MCIQLHARPRRKHRGLRGGGQERTGPGRSASATALPAQAPQHRDKGCARHARELEAGGCFLCESNKKSSNYCVLFPFPFPQWSCGVQLRSGARGTALLSEPSYQSSEIPSIHPTLRCTKVDRHQQHHCHCCSASQWLKARVCRQVWCLVLLLVVLFFYTIALCGHFTP